MEKTDCEWEPYFSGSMLWGDGFDAKEIEEWFADEAEGYSELVSARGEYEYAYHALNERHGYSALPAKQFSHVLGLGAAFGHELLPILDRIGKITIVESAGAFRTTELRDVPVRYVKAGSVGLLPLKDGGVDLITCFGVLHHIPNVSATMNELSRVLEPGGYMLLREPIVSMGDWRKPRVGLTKRERGIPFHLLSEISEKAGFEIVRRTRCMFPLIAKLQDLSRKPVYNNPLYVRIDEALCRLRCWLGTYHATTWWQKLRPTSAFFLLRKRGRQDVVNKGCDG